MGTRDQSSKSLGSAIVNAFFRTFPIGYGVGREVLYNMNREDILNLLRVPRAILWTAGYFVQLVCNIQALVLCRLAYRPGVTELVN